ncbi:hypothetical protein CWI84_04955 [Idiomarina tyrosinivorans]|uniref:cyclic-guanylate-specific phosphodiesterase n=2 Tax=Idiomarina tyrosinivorans TaxID=1445662 RepID=A0A432ZR77_9GAMM|nr:hypothetical protein CWI84_04955 [Idiomarina tyrosinivorans]
MIFDMVRDKRGFLWIATYNGLSRFDGYEFKTYYFDTEDPHSIPSNLVRNVYVDSKERLWVGTQSGLARYDEKIDGFHVYTGIDKTDLNEKDKIWSYTELPNGELMISTSIGSYIYDEKSDSFTSRSISSDKHQITEIRASFHDETNGWYWLGSYFKGIYVWDGESEQAFDISKENPITEKLDVATLFDAKRLNEQLWLATTNGLYVLDNSYRIIKHLSKEDGLSSNALRNIVQISKSVVWVASENGLNIIDLKTFDIQRVHESAIDSNSLGNNYIYRLYKDSNDIIWLGAVSGGLHRYNPSGVIITKYSRAKGHSNLLDDKIWALEEADNGKVWLATQSGDIQLFNPVTEEFTTYPIESDKSVWRLFDGFDNKLWFATSSKVGWLNPETGEYQFIDAVNGAKLSKFAYQDNALWYASNSHEITRVSLSKQSPSGYKLTRYQLPKSMLGLQYVGAYRTDMLMLGTNRELYVFHPSNSFLAGSTEIKFDKSAKIISTHEYNGEFYVATARQGLYYNGLFFSWEEANEVSSVLKDENIVAMDIVDEKLWVVTTVGVYDLSTPESPKLILSFDNELTEIDVTSAIISKDRSIYLSSLNGLIKIKLSTRKKMTETVPVVLTRVLHYSKNVALDTFSKDNPKNIVKTDVLKVNSENNQFSLQFALPTPIEPRSIKYRYRLNPLDKEWNETPASSRLATYTNLNSGKYQFIVEASSDNGSSWGGSRKLKVIVLPPWWLSLWALIAYGCLATLIASFLFINYRNKQRQAQRVKTSEERLKLSLWGSGDQLWDWNIRSGELFRHNDWEKLRNFPVDGKRWGNSQHSNIHPQDLLSMQNKLQAHLDGDTEHFEATYRVKVPNGWLWILDRGKVVAYDEKGHPLRMAGTLKDISALVAAEERVKMLATSVTNISDGICIYDTQFLLKEVNPAFEKITGFKRDEILDKPFELPLYHQGFVEQIKHELGIDGSWHGEIADRRADGSTYQMELTIDTIRDDAGDIVFYVCSFSDISERKRNETELRRLANTDTLTGLPNRSYFQMSHSNLVRKRLQHALLVFDLDNFKKVNDSLGHETGDRLLCQVVERLQNIGRKQDTLYRLGGDEFGFLIEDSTDLNLITKVATDINELVATPFFINEQEVVISSSIGIVAYPNDGNTSQELLQSADNAMYHAKRRGGNCYQFFSESMNQNAVSRLQLENTIRQALKNDWLQVHFQPKVDIASQTVAGVEALARIHVPDEGMLSPLTFIPLAEETGLIIELGEQVLRQSCRAMRQWLAAGLPPCRMAVNLSARQFNQATLVDDIERILKQERIEAKYIEFEITEGMVMQDPERAIHIMTELTEMGIHLALDDFGTGYSSLAYLKRFPIHSLKIDKAFVDDIAVSDVDRNMVASIISMAHNMGLNVVAEGVETTEQMTVLRTLRCEYAQGYLFAKPLALNHWLNFGQEQASKI